MDGDRKPMTRISWRARLNDAFLRRFPRLARLGLRRTVTLAFAAGSLAIATVLSLGTYLLARSYLSGQRVDSASRQAFADAAYVRSGLLTGGREVSDVLNSAAPPPGTVLLLQRGSTWYSSSLTRSQSTVPANLQRIVADGGVAAVWTKLDREPAIAVGVSVPAANARFYEVSPAAELDRTLDILARILAVCTALTVLAFALLGRWASARLLVPLNDVARASARIAGGELNTRLRPSRDPDLATIAVSLNAMVDALAERIEREARFTADVAHELRSPLTTLTTTVQLMESRRSELPATSQQALDLMSAELARFRGMLEDLLELGRLDAGEIGTVQISDASALVRESLSLTGHDNTTLRVFDGGPFWVKVDRGHLHRAIANLVTNADRHGDGLRRVTVSADLEHVRLCVEDAGPGVAEADRERIFARFVRGGSRGSRPGVGLGLSLVSETVRAHGGTVEVTNRAGGGARFTITLPRAVPPDTDEGRRDEPRQEPGASRSPAPASTPRTEPCGSHDPGTRPAGQDDPEVPAGRDHA